MATSRSKRVLIALAATVVIVLVVLWRLAAAPEGRGGGAVVGPGPVAATPGERPSADLRAPTATPDRERSASDAGPTSVLFPLRVELELVDSAALPVVDGRALDGGRRARLSGQIAGAHGEPILATIHFVAGPNEGRVLATDATGAFGAHDLLPGIDVVEVRGAGISGSRREVRLSTREEALLHVGYGLPGSVEGRIIDEAGEPVVGARISVDGQVATSGERGFFSTPRVAAGPVLLEVKADGFAPHRQEIGVPASGAIPASALEVRLARGATLELSIATDVGGPGPATVYLEPATSGVERRFDWAAIGPIEVGLDPVVVSDLPPVAVLVRAYRQGAIAKPPTRQVRLVASGSERVALAFELLPRVVGQVVRDGRAEVGARVRLSAGDVVAATMAHVGGETRYLDDEVRRVLPVAVQEAVTDAAGRFEFTDYSAFSPARVLEAWSADGKARAALAVHAGANELEVVLAERSAGTATLVLALPPRFQGLPVELVVAGEPRSPFVLPAREDLVVDGLDRGVWRLVATWWGEPLVRLDRLEIDREARVDVPLPDGAIEGQDEETWLRAGEEYPFR